MSLPLFPGPQVDAHDDGGGIDEQDRAQERDGDGIWQSMRGIGDLSGNGVKVHRQRHALISQAIGKEVSLWNIPIKHSAGEHNRRGFAGGA